MKLTSYSSRLLKKLILIAVKVKNNKVDSKSDNNGSRSNPKYQHNRFCYPYIINN